MGGEGQTSSFFIRKRCKESSEESLRNGLVLHLNVDNMSRFFPASLQVWGKIFQAQESSCSKEMKYRAKCLIQRSSSHFHD